MKFHFPTRTLILTASLAAMMAVSAYAYDVQGGTVTTSSAVNFRQEATTESESMGKLSDGTRVAVLDALDGWYKVAYDGEVGYMSSDYVETQPIMNIECGGAKAQRRLDLGTAVRSGSRCGCGMFSFASCAGTECKGRFE